MQVGDIFKFNEQLNGANHPFVIINLDSDYVDGVALTKSKQNGNILLREEWFEITDESGIEFEVQWKNTKYCNAKLDK